MKKLICISFVALATICFPSRSAAQGVITAPLYVFTNGSGTITPFQSGQLLNVGESYEMTAVPDFGFAFSSWQPVNVFTITTVITNSNGDADLISSVSASPVPTYFAAPVLPFTMQPEQVISATPLMTITSSSGWQANFTPAPEPSGGSLIIGGFALISFHLRTRSQVEKDIEP